MNSLLLCIFIVYLNVARFSCLPVVDSGLFVIQGVSTCGQGLGYCFLSDSCLVDTNFDIDLSGHCDGLKRAFNPNTNFVCCQTAKEETTIIATETVPATHSPVQEQTTQTITSQDDSNKSKNNSHILKDENPVSKTNSILSYLQTIMPSGRIPPQVDIESSENDNTTEFVLHQNDKSIVDLVLLGIHSTEGKSNKQ